MNSPTILIIDDEAPIRKLLEITLTANGYRVEEAVNGRDGLVTAATHPPDLVILDLGLPDEDGQQILLKLREWYNQPILILSVRNTEEEIVKALDNGANDYLVKPFRTGELLARVRAALRTVSPEQDNPFREFGNLSIDFSLRLVRKNDELLKLTLTEYNLLSLLARNEGKVLTHQFLLKVIWGPGFTTQSQYLRVYIGQLRKKIEDNPNQPKFIRTEPGMGYRFWGGQD
jgi:two-component system, OmpR family, KDP operon response regulator KdpE